ncbi:MAG TPA: ATP-binding protein [Candidatus Angelobacter sp.]|nr:ATP-binding protein [Candidatus Angelobacter sp.]
MIPRSLFLKIFLWFWLAAALIIGVFVLMFHLTYDRSLPERFRGSYSEALNLYAEAAVRVYDHDGTQAFEEFVSRSQREAGTEVYLFDGSGKSLLAQPTDEIVLAVLQDILKQRPQEQDHAYRLVLGKATWGTPVTAAAGGRYIFIARLRQASLGPPLVWSPLRLTVSILIAGLVCYLLARYLTSPLKKLQGTVQTFAEGNLDVRVGPELGGRKDEVADLGREFDHMAERIGALISSQKRLLADISHELRSPLARLSVALELARKNSNEKSVAALNRIEQESERLNGLVGQLLALTRLESGAEKVPPETVMLEELVQEIVDDADFEAQSLKRSVNVLELEACRVKGSTELLRSAIENVVRNAVRYTSEGTSVEVALQWRLDTAVLLVHDHGPGVPEGELKHIFEPFYRVSEARERWSGGTGLGLSIAERTVKLHEGSIVAQNSSTGLLVTIRLPLAPNQNGIQPSQGHTSIAEKDRVIG